VLHMHQQQSTVNRTDFVLVYSLYIQHWASKK